MKYLDLVEKFESCELDIKSWTHESHLIVALYYVINYKEQAFEKIKQKIIKFNESKGTINSDKSGYHETLTIFWIKNIELFLNKFKTKEFTVEVIDKLIKSEYIIKGYPFKFYTKDKLMSVEARKSWIEPDLKEL